MKISMAGIDHNTASIEYRERFAMTKSVQIGMLEHVSRSNAVSGCVIINTCNRMELWISSEDEVSCSPYEILCSIFDVGQKANTCFFKQRDGIEAVGHLFELACGLKSRIIGEEQILSQVKESITISRQCGAADPILETLFRNAVTAAKKAKTKVHLTAVDRSASKTAVELLKRELIDLKGLDCLVIGSGEMGRLAAKELVLEGCKVTITRRSYKTGIADIPSGCKAIDYEDRYQQLGAARVIFSATRSPHYTLRYDQVKDSLNGSEKWIFDLAVPRDIDLEIARIPNIKLFDIDDLGEDLTEESEAKVAEVKGIIRDSVAEFGRWNNSRSMLVRINEPSTQAAEDARNRILIGLKKTKMNEDIISLLCETACKAVSKAVGKLIYDLNKDAGAENKGNFIQSYQEYKFSIFDEGSSKKTPPLRFPLFIDLSGKEVLIIGAGNIALRRIMALQRYSCRIKVIALQANAEIEGLDREKKLSLEIRQYDHADIDSAFLVIAATGDRQLNHRISQDAHIKGRYCSIADCKEECSFYFPAIVEYPGGVIGICGTGEDHKRTKEVSSNIRRFVSDLNSLNTEMGV